MEYNIWCDESVKKGEYYSNFYGGVLVRSIHLEEVTKKLEAAKTKQNFYKELKWNKVTGNYLQKYKDFIDAFFELVSQDKIKVRIFFTHNLLKPKALTREHKEEEFFILYYQFFKHIFGLQYSNDTGKDINIRLNFDKLPDKLEKVKRFKQFIADLDQWEEFRNNGIRIKPRYITEIDSKEHVLLQSLDIVLGAMAFKLNRKNLEHSRISSSGRKMRGKRTIAKEKLYKHINSQICRNKENFNIGITTGIEGDIFNRWRHVYRHWCFESYDSEINEEYGQ